MSKPEHNRRWLLVERPTSSARTGSFERVDAPIPEAADGEFVVRVTHVSFDPTQLGWMAVDGYMPAVPLGEVMRALGVGQVVSSRHPGFQVGQMVHGGFGWQDYALTNGRTEVMPVSHVPPGSTAVQAASVFGLTGLTAYFGLHDIGRPRPGETVMVSAAAGATGSVAVQLAKAMGCRVIGIAGGPEKCAWVRDVAGADACIDYKSENVWQALGVHAPKGLNVVFENVGDGILEAAIMRLALRARIVLCGTIASYLSGPREQQGVRFLLNLSTTRSRMEGFIVLDYEARYPEARAELAGLLADGRLHVATDVQQGFENIPATLDRLFEGRNLGKQLLQIAEPPLPD